MGESSMSHLERILAARAGEPVDRVPVSLWCHWPGADQSAETLAEATVKFAKRFDFDLIKVTPSGLSGVADWGVRSDAPFSDHGEPTIIRWAIGELEDWSKLQVLDPSAGRLAQELGALRAIGIGLSGTVPYMQTAFLPLTTAGKLAGRRLVSDLREHPDLIHHALRIITDTTVAYLMACLTHGGASGVFLSTKYANEALLTREEYLEFGVPYDLEVLECISHLSQLTVLHLHGEGLHYDLFTSYPVDFFNWHDRGGGPTLAEGSRMFSSGLMGGISNSTEFICGASLDELHAQVRDAIAQVGGRRLVVAPGCVLPTGMSEARYRTIREAVEG
jgi:uroporphyrinogen decarboxylase